MKFGISEVGRFLHVERNLIKTWAYTFSDYLKPGTNATIDWAIRESARANLMVLVKRTLTKHGYHPG